MSKYITRITAHKIIHDRLYYRVQYSDNSYHWEMPDITTPELKDQNEKLLIRYFYNQDHELKDALTQTDPIKHLIFDSQKEDTNRKFIDIFDDFPEFDNIVHHISNRIIIIDADLRFGYESICYYHYERESTIYTDKLSNIKLLFPKDLTIFMLSRARRI
ncbi:hypothetical protein TVAG_037880 [Trichomonas vaginalis G3]|uniref:Uncharacterized protein n=1 Tax=Trichomonas vaginalis (strain ATCC PRA-98 / G3) TaxID=412133 RepID=A2FZF3_TRIV3|nr:hypothetical protein TVAGG3_0229940 [Trichomonas vaginalis G3]EAX89705.1 hypothetical protein TVAG_037880 [Trichomonas vaginalis G3]KAI5552550.1 hypothetical protein TVAGG3_0229940 [Trichomonas vaginalis G3]|eukprot:XP_001302635.1 hypothetical protein [Trichomonas vaginalis G3]